MAARPLTRGARRTGAGLLRLGALAFLLSSGCGEDNRTTLIPDGIWGTATAQLDVTATGAALTLCCAKGTINPPLTVSPAGTFDLTGTYTRQAGPIPIEGFKPESATYAGIINGDRMNLTLTSPPIGSESFTLTLGVTKTALCVCAL
jgi:hypothetical protein